MNNTYVYGYVISWTFCGSAIDEVHVDGGFVMADSYTEAMKQITKCFNDETIFTITLNIFEETNTMSVKEWREATDWLEATAAIARHQADIENSKTTNIFSDMVAETSNSLRKPMTEDEFIDKMAADYEAEEDARFDWIDEVF